MEYKNVHIIYFSPTHTSAKTAYAIAEGLGGSVLLESDITYDAPTEELEIHDDELTIVAAPVYGGRVAETAMERLRVFHAHQAPVVPVVVYGNRDYEDALEIDKIEDYVEYIYSMASMVGLDRKNYDVLLNYFNSKKTDGYLHVPKECGMFVAGIA